MQAWTSVCICHISGLSIYRFHAHVTVTLFEATPDFDALLHFIDYKCVPSTALSYTVLITEKCSEFTETVLIKMK